LEDVVDKLRDAGWHVVNADATVIAERPTLSRYFGAMRANLALVLDIDETRVNLKATTSETMGATGRGEGIAAWAVCLIQAASECPDT
jgi:2-C-methyl-D-erythritol 2,4-cyclodiphosphate synthase